MNRSRVTKFGVSAVCLLLLTLFVGCASQPSDDRPAPTASEAAQASQVEPEARALYASAEKSFESRNLDLALRQFQTVKAKFPRGRAAVLASYRLGIIYYYRETYAAAAKEFENFVTKSPQSELSFDATYNWAACEHQLGRNDRSYQILSRLKLADVQAQGPKRAETVYQLTARVATALKLPVSAVTAYALQLQLPVEDSVRNAVEAKVDEQLAQIQSPQKLQDLLNDVSEPTVRRKIESRLVALNPAATPASPVATGGAPIPAIPTTSVSEPVSEPTTLTSSGTTGVSTHVGVVLPLSGKWASYGKRALDGILLAANSFGEGGSDFQIFVRDSESNPIVAQNAVEDLYAKHNVMAVIGPISYKESVAVAEKAQSIGLPNISLATKEGISDKSPYLFQTGLTPAVQIENLVRFAVQQRGFKRFAILAPNNAFGRDMADSFWDYVSKSGAVVSAYHLYEPNEQDFQDQIRDLVGLADLKYRRLEATKLADYVREVKEKTKKEPKTQLSPIIDFDAIFIPDSPKAVSQAAASLNYFDAAQVPLLGTAEWNSDQFFRRGASLIQTAIFPAGLYLGSQESSTRDFVRTYQEAYGVSPDLLAAQSYEAMALLGYAIRNARSDDRNQLANQLGSIRELATPLGTLTFDSQRVGRRKLAVLSFENGTAITEH